MRLHALWTRMTLVVWLGMTLVTSYAALADADMIGQAHFPTSCSAEAQAHFDRAITLLHSFWFSEALKAFDIVLGEEPSCAMGYWGIAMSLRGNPLAGPPSPQTLRQGEAILLRAKPVGVRTEREYDYLQAISLFYRDVEASDHRTRALAYTQAMERLTARYPDDAEAAIFYALALNSTAPPTDKTFANQLKAAAILEKIVPQQPHHPGVAHYLLHSYDHPSIAAKGLAAARWYARLAPPVPSALHLPSHIFTRLGLWQESIETNRASAMAAREALRATPPAGTDFTETLHAMDYMMYGYMQLAHDQAARRMIEAVTAIRQIDVEHLEAAYALAAIPARYALERRHWEDAAALQLYPLAWDRFPQSEAVTVFARGLGAARSGKTAAARQEVARLQALRNVLGTSGEKYWADQIDLQRQIVSAWLAHAAGKKEEAVKLLRAAAALEDAMEPHHVTPGPIAPARELLGELLLELNQPALALQAFEASHRVAPHRFKGLYGAARAAELADEKAKAWAFYTQLVTMCEHADSERPELSEARTFLAQQ